MGTITTTATADLSDDELLLGAVGEVTGYRRTLDAEPEAFESSYVRVCRDSVYVHRLMSVRLTETPADDGGPAVRVLEVERRVYDPEQQILEEASWGVNVVGDEVDELIVGATGEVVRTEGRYETIRITGRAPA